MQLLVVAAGRHSADSGYWGMWFEGASCGLTLLPCGNYFARLTIIYLESE